MRIRFGGRKLLDQLAEVAFKTGYEAGYPHGHADGRHGVKQGYAISDGAEQAWQQYVSDINARLKADD